MRLSEDEYYLFIEIHHALILFAGKKYKVVKENLSLDAFRPLGTDVKFPCREKLYEHPEVIDQFIAQNPYQFSAEELSTINDFKHFMRGQFFVLKYLKEYTVFLHKEVAYGVLALNDPFYNFFGDRLPVAVEAVLLPFKGKIIYDGMLQSYPVFFGSGYRSSLNEIYKEAKANYGIVTSLPFDGKAAYENLSAEEQLSYFMKNKTNREQFEHEVKDLLRRKPKLLPKYHQILGKIQATQYKKKLKALGLKKGYFALLEGVLISGAPTKEDIDEIILVLVPEKKVDWVYVFKL